MLLASLASVGCLRSRALRYTATRIARGLQEYPTQSWPDVVAAFSALAEANPHFERLRDFVARVAASPFAQSLHPIKSMHTLRLYQHERVTDANEEVRMDWDDGEFVVRYLPGGATKTDPRFSLRPPLGMWTKRGADGMALMERSFHHLCWFVGRDTTERGTSAPPGQDASRQDPDAAV